MMDNPAIMVIIFFQFLAITDASRKDGQVPQVSGRDSSGGDRSADGNSDDDDANTVVAGPPVLGRGASRSWTTRRSGPDQSPSPNQPAEAVPDSPEARKRQHCEDEFEISKSLMIRILKADGAGEGAAMSILKEETEERPNIFCPIPPVGKPPTWRRITCTVHSIKTAAKKIWAKMRGLFKKPVANHGYQPLVTDELECKRYHDILVQIVHVIQSPENKDLLKTKSAMIPLVMENWKIFCYIPEVVSAWTEVEKFCYRKMSSNSNPYSDGGQHRSNGESVVGRLFDQIGSFIGGLGSSRKARSTVSLAENTRTSI